MDEPHQYRHRFEEMSEEDLLKEYRYNRSDYSEEAISAMVSVLASRGYSLEHLMQPSSVDSMYENIEMPDLHPYELGYMELRLRWIVVWRLLCTLAVPLAVAVVFEDILVEIICWLITAWLFWTLVRSWGHSVIALIVALVPLYLYFEWNYAPDWLAYLASFLMIFEFTFIKKRIDEIAIIRSSGH